MPITCGQARNCIHDCVVSATGGGEGAGRGGTWSVTGQKSSTYYESQLTSNILRQDYIRVSCVRTENSVLITFASHYIFALQEL